jgi:hypothetical protein
MLCQEIYNMAGYTNRCALSKSPASRLMHGGQAWPLAQYMLGRLGMKLFSMTGKQSALSIQQKTKIGGWLSADR